MAISKKAFSDYVKKSSFRELFNDLGWNNDKTTTSISIENTTYHLKAVAEKCGLKILTCEVDELPNTEKRNKLDTQIKRLFFHYILICINKQEDQKWIIPIKKSEKRELAIINYSIHQIPEFLYQKISSLYFSLEQEDKLTIVDVSKLVNDLFTVNSEKITKEFYDNFKKEHDSFLKFIKGISEIANQEWYASLMLNRLMFCYFIQKKGFLDNNKNYLRDKLNACKEKKGEENFYSFYRDFLLVLFHKGLNESEQSQETKIEIGKIPYLNGGLFDEHELEKTIPKIDISDKAFESLFDFFDKYEWHLDTSVAATGKDINPDVIGYIFEKYINDRADMGAYYTKEDITDYISKNCILPFLFDEIKRNYPKAFTSEGELWQMVKQSDDKYIYDAIKKGLELPLPKDIENGISDINKRDTWNNSAPINYSLSTEIWREVIDRRNRYKVLKDKIDKGEIAFINNFITDNLNIRQFVQDTIENTNDPNFLKYFYEALKSVTIIDPTCGSGAFLFAAMNILEPLYECCIHRMNKFVSEAPKEKYKDFEKVLKQVKNPQHPNLQYFIYKSIILQNLYGVDIMKEAVEIAKLRLFLKLVSTVEADYRKPNLGIEPLPDIDFNIRSENTLVGFATENELKEGLKWQLNFEGEEERINEKCDIIANAFKRYKEIQLTYGDDFKEFKKAKEELNNRLKELNHELNQILHKQTNAIPYNTWLETYQPFHWFAEFYESIQGKGGFDIVIGNPPYVEYSKIKYKINGYKTIKSGNLYAFVIERGLNISSKFSRIGMIIPISSICTDRMIDYQKMIGKYNCWNSLYAERPSKLFSGAEVQLVITLLSNDKVKNIHSSTYNKWAATYRDFLFQIIDYTSITDFIRPGSFPKIGTEIEKSILQKLERQNMSINHYQLKKGKYFVNYRNAGGRYYKVILNFEPNFKLNNEPKRSSTYQFLYFDNKEMTDSTCALMNSSLFFWYWLVYSDTWHMVNREIGNFKISFNDPLIKTLSQLNKELMKDLKKNSIERKENRNKGVDVVEYTQYNVRESKSIIDDIDTALAKHYNFTSQELDFIINYDIKYRMSKDIENENEQ